MDQLHLFALCAVLLSYRHPTSGSSHSANGLEKKVLTLSALELSTGTVTGGNKPSIYIYLPGGILLSFPPKWVEESLSGDVAPASALLASARLHCPAAPWAFGAQNRMPGMLGEDE